MRCCRATRRCWPWSSLHGLFWSGLLVAAASYVTDIVPPNRRAEGLSYWGMSTIFAVSMAPAIGLWVYESRRLAGALPRGRRRSVC